MTVLYLLISFVVGGVTGFVVSNNRCISLRNKADLAEREKEAQRMAFENERNSMNQTIQILKDNFEHERSSLKQTYDETRAEMERQWKEKAELMKSQFQQMAADVLQDRSDALKKSNLEQINLLFNPLRDEMGSVQKAVKETLVSNAQQKVSFENALEVMMKQTQQIGEDAVQLTKALKGSGKVQGDWGEQLLESILEQSGLRKDYEFFLQANTKDEEGNNLRPDVIVRCPGNKQVVVDSKVSLTAYAAYVSAENEEERKRYEKENLISVKKHIDELAAKDYDKLVEHSITHVLMFIPNEGSYILALRTDPQIGAYAFRKGVLVINPTNLMMALQLIYNLWQSERQSRNIEDIIRQSSDLYDKFVTFIETFNQVNDSLEKAQKSFEKAKGQLYMGKGNIVRRLEGLKELGVTPKKNIPDTAAIEE